MKFCILMVMGLGLICSGDRQKAPVVDRTCDLEIVRLPAEWRAQCVGPDKRLRKDVSLDIQRFCQKQLANQRILKQRCS